VDPKAAPKTGSQFVLGVFFCKHRRTHIERLHALAGLDFSVLEDWPPTMRPARSCLGWRNWTRICRQLAALALKLIARSPQLLARGRMAFLFVAPAGPNCRLGVKHKRPSFFAQSGRQAQCRCSQRIPLSLCCGVNPVLHKSTATFCCDLLAHTVLLPSSDQQ